MKNKCYAVLRYWEVRDEVEVVAATRKEAIEKAHALPLTANPDFVTDSMNTDPQTDIQVLKGKIA